METVVKRFEETHPDAARILKLYNQGTTEEIEKKLWIKKGSMRIYVDNDDYVVMGTLIKVGRNERCPCGSGNKYKRCCLGRETDGKRNKRT